MKISVTSPELKIMIPQIAAAIGSKCSSYCDEFIAVIPQSLGRGFVRGYDFQNGVGLIEWNVQFKEDVEIEYRIPIPHPLRFLYVLEGRLRHACEPDMAEEEIGSLQGMMSATSSKATCVDRFFAETPTHMTAVTINRREYLPKIECYLDTLPDTLSETFRDVEGIDPIVILSDYSASLSSCIATIAGDDNTGLTRRSYQESKALELFALHMRQYLDRLNESLVTRRVALRKTDVDMIRAARNILVADLRNTPTIAELARMIGMNENKLQKGFKQVFGATINKYVRDVRLQTANHLIQQNDLSIAEIAELVGYSNGSQFAARFKEKFGILPSDFLRSVRTMIGIDGEALPNEQSVVSSGISSHDGHDGHAPSSLPVSASIGQSSAPDAKS